MRIAILGATSQIAKDLVLSFSVQGKHELTLFARRPDAVTQWLACVGLSGRYAAVDFKAFGTNEHFDAVLNFVGVGDPAQAATMGASIFDVTLKYDEMALDYLRHYPNCRYIFLSSGAAYGSSFDEPANEDTKAVVAINNLQPQDWYGAAKLHAECRHRALAHLPIVDIRVFNYFSHTQDMAARFLMTDVVRAIQAHENLITSSQQMVRDYIGPADFYELISRLLIAPAANDVVDCYTKEPVDKQTLLTAMQVQFGLRYTLKDTPVGVNATGSKKNYFSRNHRAQTYGYSPNWSSLETIISETKLVVLA